MGEWVERKVHPLLYLGKDGEVAPDAAAVLEKSGLVKASCLALLSRPCFCRSWTGFRNADEIPFTFR